MGIFSDVLLTVDYDRTLTAPNSTIPERNLEAIRYFMDNGGAFTVNTGRSVPMTYAFREKVPVNAPLLLYNGSAAYDLEKMDFTFFHRIDIPMYQLVEELMEAFPDMNVEVQGTDAHYLFKDNPKWFSFTENNGCPARIVPLGTDIGPLVKLCMYGEIREDGVAHLFNGTPEEIERTNEIQRLLNERYGDKLSIFRVAQRIIDLHAKGVSKGQSARQLLQELNRKILVCVGDERNDLSMLDEADYAYCPSDAVIADRYENVCACGEGAVADVIYKKIPEILGINP